jgi:hypothetical protein
MNHPQFNDEATSRIVYIRSVDTSEIPQAREHGVTAEHVYAIHDAKGKRLAVVADRAAAFAVARQNAMTPVSVH